MEEPPSSTTTATSSPSPLDKPLYLLTEDDISQLTREDCRKFLKQKGMRKPSWNKSQAIQQVIMLKALLEPVPESDDRKKRLYISSSSTTRVQKGTSVDMEISLSAEESVPDILADNDSAPPPPPPPGIGGGTEEAKGQMTIFYRGKVNVYDDIPADKARALLQLAASPLQFPHEDSFDGNRLQPPRVNMGTEFPVMPSPNMQTVRMTDNYRLHKEESNKLREESSADGSASRKASVQRYLEKRKDRFKSKRKVGAPACSSLDAYVNHQIGNQNLHDQSSRSATCSPPPVRPPNTPNRFS